MATRAAERLREHGIRATLISGGSAVESTELLREAVRLGTDAVAVAGGDGTVSLAMQVLAHSTTPLGIIPAGTGNDLADMLGIRELHPDEAADAIVGGLTRDIDLARISRHGEPEVYFGSVLASGFDSRVNDRANRMRWPRGSSRYTIAILRELVGLRSFAYEIELTDAAGSVTRHDGALLMAAVANGTSYGGGVQIAPRADPA
ncbi:MAG TPA: diacylglycerol kinase, partial [Microbacterium sp.]|nr:diacylglycerol kinase [Microbacterium sp.]